MEEDSTLEPASLQMTTDNPGSVRMSAGFKRERGLSKALSVLRANTKLQQQKRISSSHALVVEDEEGLDFEEDSTSLDDSSSRRRTGTGSGSAPVSRTFGRQRGTAVVSSVEGQRRNAPRGEWSQAEEAVLARKHMELGNKWTTISHFLPARSDNDVKNIWHSTLRSKNSERRSFLRTYARAVRDCANDAEARRQAYEMAQQVCGPPQPIELAIAAVQQQYQQQMQMQAHQQEELLENGQSPEHQQDQERDGAHDHERDINPSSNLGVQELSPRVRSAQPALEPLLDALRSGTCSRTTSAAGSQQHSAMGLKGRLSPGPSPFPKSLLRGQPGPMPSPSPLDTLDAAAAAGGMQAYQSLLHPRGHLSAHSLSHSHQHTQMLAVDDSSLPPSSRASEIDSSCLARLSALHLADQLHRQHQHQLGAHNDPLGIVGGNSSCSGHHGRALLSQQQMLASGYGSQQLGRGSATGMVAMMPPRGPAQEPVSALGGSGSQAVDLDDLLALGLDLTPDELTMLAQGNQAGADGNGATDGKQAQAAPSDVTSGHTAEKVLGLSRAMQQQQQQHRFVASAHASSLAVSKGLSLQQMQQRAALPPQPGSLTLDSSAPPLLRAVNVRNMAGGSGPATTAATEQQQADAIDSLFAELEQKQRFQPPQPQPLSGGYSLQQQQQQQQLQQQQLQQQQQQLQQQQLQHEDVLGLAWGSAFSCGRGPPGTFDPSCNGSGSRCGFIAPHNTCVEFHSLASCSSTIDLLTSGHQAYVDGPRPPPGHLSICAGRASGLGMLGGCQESFSNASSGLLSPLGLGSALAGSAQRTTQFASSTVWAANQGAAAGSAAWPNSLLRSGPGSSSVRTLSSPAPFCCDTGAGGGVGDGASALAVTGFPMLQTNGGSGVAGRGSGLIPNMSSLATPAPVDVVTMGLDSGNLLDCMECEGEPAAESGSGAAAAAAESLDMTLRASARGSFSQQQQQRQHPQQQQQQVGMSERGPGSQGMGPGANACPQPCWPASMPPYHTGRIGPMLRL